MSRTRNAIFSATFTYAHLALAMLSGIALVPLTLNRLGPRMYGLWLATGEVLSYTAVLELGVFAVLPWMVAGADGRTDRRAMRSFLVHGVVLGSIIGAACLLLGCLLYWLLPAALKFTGSNSREMLGPLSLLLGVTALSYPLRVFSAVLIGLQDVIFNGILGIVCLVLKTVILAVLLLRGHGLYALSAAAAIPAALAVIASLWRARAIAPDIFSHWPKPTLSGLALLLREGVGCWLGAFGVQLLGASNSLVITFLGHPEWVPIYACTAKMSQILVNFCWVLPDSGLAGIAQLHGESRTVRVREVVSAVLRLHLLLSGATACLCLALNPAFVRWWVGPRFFGGLPLNTFFAIGLISSSLVHGLVTAIGVLGSRLQVGIATLINGVLQVALAVLLGVWWGLSGIIAAALLSSLVTSVPFGLIMLKHLIGLDYRSFFSEVLSPWLTRVAPLLVLSAALGLFCRTDRVFFLAAFVLPFGFLYLWWLSPIFLDLPLDPRMRRLAGVLSIFRYRSTALNAHGEPGTVFPILPTIDDVNR